MKVWSFYCESKKDNLHAFCLLRSPYKRSVQYKIQELSDGHGFLEWSYIKMTPEQEKEFLENSYEFDTLYVRDPKEIN